MIHEKILIHETDSKFSQNLDYATGCAFDTFHPPSSVKVSLLDAYKNSSTVFGTVSNPLSPERQFITFDFSI